MTILPNKKLKANRPDDERQNERKRPRTSPYPTSQNSLNHERTKKHHPSTSGLQKAKSKTKVRREVKGQVDGGFTPRESYTPPLSPCISANPRVPPIPPTVVPQEDEEKNTGYNSEDEYDRKVSVYSEEREAEFRRILQEKRGFEIIDVEADGACLFRSVSDQIYGDEGMHDIIRAKCCDYMELNADYFRDWVTEDFSNYIERKRILHTHGNHIELQAMSEQYGRLFEIYEYSHIPIKTFQCSEETDNPPIRLSYHNGNHYNSVRDPYRATIGIGLGIPNLNPGVQTGGIAEALAESEKADIETRMLLDKAQHTDYQATDQALLATVARESLQEFYKKNKKSSKIANSLNKLEDKKISRRSRSPSPPRQASTKNFKSDQASNPPPSSVAQRTPNPQSPPRDEPGPSHSMSADPQWAISDWVSQDDEESVLEAILQQSAQEFYSSKE